MFITFYIHHISQRQKRW